MKQDISSDSELYIPLKNENSDSNKKIIRYRLNKVRQLKKLRYTNKHTIVIHNRKTKIKKEKNSGTKKYYQKYLCSLNCLDQNSQTDFKEKKRQKYQQKKCLEMDTILFTSQYSISSLFDKMANLQIKQVLK